MTERCSKCQASYDDLVGLRQHEAEEHGCARCFELESRLDAADKAMERAREIGNRQHAKLLEQQSRLDKALNLLRESTCQACGPLNECIVCDPANYLNTCDWCEGHFALFPDKHEPPPCNPVHYDGCETKQGGECDCKFAERQANWNRIVEIPSFKEYPREPYVSQGTPDEQAELLKQVIDRINPVERQTPFVHEHDWLPLQLQPGRFYCPECGKYK